MTTKIDKNVAVYAGTFDPITNGHEDIIERAASVFDTLFVAIADNPSKSPLFDLNERREMIEEIVSPLGSKIKVSTFNGLLVKHCREIGAAVIIRGLRAISDYEYESQMAMTNRQLDSEIETVFLMTSKRCSFISASIVRDVAKHGGDVSELVPENVQRAFKQKLATK